MHKIARTLLPWMLAAATTSLLAAAPPASRPASTAPPASFSARPAVVAEECVIRFAEIVDVPALDSGPLAEVAVKQNQEIQAGQLLARLDERSLAIRRHAAELKREIAQQQVADELEIKFAETAYQEALEELESNRAVYDASSGAVPLSTLRRLRIAVERANLERERVKKLNRRAEIELELQTAELEVIDDHLRRLKVESPISGVVLTIDHRVGEWMAVGESVAQVARLDRLQIQALLSEEALPQRTANGAAVLVRWSEAGVEHSLRGRVVSVNPQQLSGGRYLLHATIENRAVDGGWLLLPGREVQMTIYPLSSSGAAPSPPAAGGQTSSSGATPPAATSSAAAPATAAPQSALRRLTAPGGARR